MRTLIKILIGILLFASLCLTFASFVLDKAINDNEAYLDNILTEDFDARIIKDAEKNIRNEGDQLALDYDRICASLDKEELISLAHSYTYSFINAVFNGTEFDNSVEYRPDALYDEIVRQISEIDDEEYDITEEEKKEDAALVFDYISDDIKSAVKFIPDYIARRVIPLGKKVEKVKPYVKSGKWFLAVSVLLTAALAFVSIRKTGVRAGLIWVIFPYWFASSAVFVPSLMFSIYDSTSKITISKSSLYYILSGILETLEKITLYPTAIFFAIVTVTVFVSAYFYIFDDGRDDDNEGQEGTDNAEKERITEDTE